jgi:hypothetical protein
MISSWWRRNRKGTSSTLRHRTSQRLHQPSLEVLENRVMLSAVNWIGGSGDWNTAGNWLDQSTLTNHVPGPTDDAVINIPGITVTHSSSSHTVQSLTVNDAFRLIGGTLVVSGNLQEQDANTFLLAGGTLASATVLVGTTLYATNTNGGGTLSGVTLNGTLDMSTSFNGSSAAYLNVINGMALNGTIMLGSAVGRFNTGVLSTLSFVGSQTLEAGELDLAGTGWSNALSGTIQANGSALFRLEGALTNRGTIKDPLGTTFLQGTLNNTGSTLALDDTTGSWYLLGTISGGTVSTAGNAELIGSNIGGTLDGVKLAGTLDLASATFTHASVTVKGGITLDQGLVKLFSFPSLAFQGTQILGGTGLVALTTVNSGFGLLVPGNGDTPTESNS